MTMMTKIDLWMSLDNDIIPSMKEVTPEAHANNIGMVNVRLLKNVAPPRWLKTLIIRKKKAKHSIKIMNMTKDPIPDLESGKRLNFISITSYVFCLDLFLYIILHFQYISIMTECQKPEIELRLLSNESSIFSDSLHFFVHVKEKDGGAIRIHFSFNPKKLSYHL